MAFIFADTVGDFGRQLNQRRSQLATSQNAAANATARFAFEAQRVRQAQADQNARIVASAMQQAADDRRGAANFAMNQAAQAQAQAVRQAQAEKQFEFEAAQAALDRTAAENESSRRFEFQQNQQQEALATRRLREGQQASAGGSLALLPATATDADLVSFFSRFSPDPVSVQAMVGNYKQEALQNYQTALRNRESQVARMAEEAIDRAEEDRSRGGRSGRNSDPVDAGAIRNRVEASVPQIPRPAFLGVGGTSAGRPMTDAEVGALIRSRLGA